MDLNDKIQIAFKEDKVLIENFLDGRVSVGVIQNKNEGILPITEIIVITNF